MLQHVTSTFLAGSSDKSDKEKFNIYQQATRLDQIKLLNNQTDAKVDAYPTKMLRRTCLPCAYIYLFDLLMTYIVGDPAPRSKLADQRYAFPMCCVKISRQAVTRLLKNCEASGMTS